MKENRRGNYFEDFHVGMRIRHATPRTLTEGDRSLYIGLTGSRAALCTAHTNAHQLGFERQPLEDEGDDEAIERAAEQVHEKGEEQHEDAPPRGNAGERRPQDGDRLGRDHDHQPAAVQSGLQPWLGRPDHRRHEKRIGEQEPQAQAFLDAATAVGLDTAAIEAAMAAGDATIVERDLDDAIAVGVTGTPTFFVDGKRVTSRSFESLRGMIEESLTAQQRSPLPSPPAKPSTPSLRDDGPDTQRHPS